MRANAECMIMDCSSRARFVMVKVSVLLLRGGGRRKERAIEPRPGGASHASQIASQIASQTEESSPYSASQSFISIHHSVNLATLPALPWTTMMPPTSRRYHHSPSQDYSRTFIQQQPSFEWLDMNYVSI